MNRKKAGVLMKNLPVFLLMAAVILTMAATYHASGTLLDSDASSELVLSHHLAETNQILSEDWYYSTEIRVLNTQLVYSLLFRVLDDWRKVRFLGALILQALMVASYGYLTKQAGLGRRAFLLGAALLLLPVSIAYGRIVLWHSYYVPHIAIGFWVTGLTLAIVRDGKSRPVRQWLRWVLLLGVSFLSGMGGIRLAVTVFAPLIGTMLLYGLHVSVDARKGNPISGEKTLARRGLETLLLPSASFFGGLLVNNLVLAKRYSFSSHSDIGFLFIPDYRLKKMIKGFFQQFGFRPETDPGTLTWIVSMLGLAAGMYCLAVGISAMFRKRDVGRSVTGSFFAVACSILVVIFLFIDSPHYYPLYFIPAAAWAVPMLVQRSEPAGRFLRLRRAMYIAVMTVLFISGLFNIGYIFSEERDSQKYEGLTFNDPRLVEKLTPVVGFLTEKGYTYGYSEFWSANLLTEMTDGQIRVVPLFADEVNNSIFYYRWLTFRDLHEEETEKSFIVVYGNTEGKVREVLPEAADLRPVYDDGTYIVFDIGNRDALCAYLQEPNDIVY